MAERKKITKPVVKELDWKEKKDYLIWQGYTEGYGISEPALHVKGYTDVINIQQEGDDIRINYESVHALIEVLTKIKKKHK